MSHYIVRKLDFANGEIERKSSSGNLLYIGFSESEATKLAKKYPPSRLLKTDIFPGGLRFKCIIYESSNYPEESEFFFSDEEIREICGDNKVNTINSFFALNN